ncbi:MAG: sodium:proline symporter, partial [Phycisphaerae bacterium]|nr:sodium:proline symporter [Phycisphaerae bacterium]
MAAIDWIIVAAYLVFALGVGIYFARRAGRSTTEFFISGRNLPWWLAGTSMVATSFASDTPLVITGWVRRFGISYNWLWWSFAIGGMFSVFLLSRLWRRARVVTDIELTELRYGGRSAAVLRAFRGAYMA